MDWRLRYELGVAEVPLKVEFLKRNQKSEKRPELIQSQSEQMDDQVMMDSTSGCRGNRDTG